jgi:hypothetical protein
MPAENSTALFILSCPSGGFLNVCSGHAESHFIGCCASNACSLGCSDGNLRNTSFEASLYHSSTDQICPQGASFYTCADLNPPFWGCCKTNPCTTGGCPPGDLEASFLLIENGNPFLPGSATKSPHKVGTIVGGVIGGLVALILVFIACFKWRRKVNAAPGNSPATVNNRVQSDGTLYEKNIWGKL